MTDRGAPVATGRHERVLPGVDPVVQRRTVGVVGSAQVLSGIAIAGSIPAGSLIAVGVAGTESAAGLAQTSGVVGAALASLPLARLTLSRGRRGAIGAGYATGALGAAVVVVGAVARVLPLVYLGCLLVGVGSAAGYQARYAATDLAAADHRARALSVVVWAATVGAVLGPNLLEVSGRLGQAVGVPQLAGPYLVAGACLALAALVLSVLLRPDPYLLARRLARAAGDEVRSRPRLRDGLAHVRAHPPALLGMGAVAVGHATMVMVMVMTPVHMRHVDVSLQLVGLVISVHVAGMYALSPVVGWSADRYGRRPVIGAGVVLLLVACVVSGLAPADDVRLLGVGLFLLGLGWSCTLVAGSTLLVEATPPVERPSVQGASDLVMNVAGAVGGALAGVVVGVWSYGWLCAVAALPVLGLAGWLGSTSRRGPG